MRACRLMIVMLAVLAAGCARQAPPPAVAMPSSALDEMAYGRGVAVPMVAAAPVVVPVPEPAMAYAAREPAYTLDSGDKLRVVVFGQDSLSNTYAVDAGGRIAMPLIGSVSARGLTTAGLSQAIAAKLRNGFIREPHVAVEVETYRPFFILGEVTAPGQYAYVANMTVETAVAIAGGYTPRASHSAAVLTRNINGVTVRNEVPPGYKVQPGDTITVNERWF